MEQLLSKMNLTNSGRSQGSMNYTARSLLQGASVLNRPLHFSVLVNEFELRLCELAFDLLIAFLGSSA